MTPAQDLAVQFIEGAGLVELRLAGPLTLATAASFWRAAEARRPAAGPLRVELSGLTEMDGAGAALLSAFRRRRERQGAPVELRGAPPAAAALLARYAAEAPPPPAAVAPSLLQHVGEAACATAWTLREILGFIGDLALAAGRALRAPRSVGWAGLAPQLERAGADGVPIVLLINFLLGAILALQSVRQLADFGVSLYSANLVGVAITRELGPLMTAIIVAGRSGAGFAAELGAMTVAEEVDALRTLGLDPLRFLVFPRVLALLLAVPVLTLLGDVVACLGGLCAAGLATDVGHSAFLQQLARAVMPADVGGGLIKSAVYAGAIALISCQRGLAARNGAAGVGLFTTSAVVTILFSLVLIDAVFTVAYSLLGI